MKADVIRWVREPVSDELATDAINDAIESLWQSLILANVGSYLSRKPERLTVDGEEIPFEELGCLAFIRYWAISLLLLSVFEFDAAEHWRDRAEQARLQALQEVLQASRREESVEYYDPYQVN